MRLYCLCMAISGRAKALILLIMAAIGLVSAFGVLRSSWGKLGPSGMGWNEYSDPSGRFHIQYPDDTHPEMVKGTESALVSRVVFNFEQPFHVDQDVGSTKFQFRISVWRNTDGLSADEWARRHTSRRLPTGVLLPSLPVPTTLAGRKGATVTTSNLVWNTVETFVGDTRLMYELDYMDIPSMQALPSDVRARWADILMRMLHSFTLTQ
jgi:hypothetical protein